MISPINKIFSMDGPEEVRVRLGAKAKALRLFKGFKRVTLSDKCGVSPETIRNFEQSGKITLENFIRITYALEESSKLDNLFDLPELSSIKEIIQRQHTQPKRGRK
ncbi:MAG: helix-turn-helix transcriptional regulator [Mariprofundaceae bacterium]|nr:helix-turn-helix transcriptional regulator [Mariprofundaceae bacterium]